ncbi:hypothetical protein PM082_018859 [Marasmius tenuissimus]|nr:hypothetical protein PM082_018859 [Marasmius tenuissimus]
MYKGKEKGASRRLESNRLARPLVYTLTFVRLRVAITIALSKDNIQGIRTQALLSIRNLSVRRRSSRTVIISTLKLVTCPLKLCTTAIDQRLRNLRVRHLSPFVGYDYSIFALSGDRSLS